MKTINNNLRLANKLSDKLSLDLFYALSITEYQIYLQGRRSDKVMRQIKKLGMVKNETNFKKSDDFPFDRYEAVIDETDVIVVISTKNN